MKTTTQPQPQPPQKEEPLRELALFAGNGGGLLGGTLLGWRTICAVEINPYCARRLMQRQNERHLPPFPIWDDVCTFDGRPWRGRVDVISGGFPCQDISAAGKGTGIEGERSGLWKEFARIIREVGPRFVLVENSPMLTLRGLGTVLGDLASMGYDAKWGVIGAEDSIWLAGDPAVDHQRERIWIRAEMSHPHRIHDDHGGYGTSEILRLRQTPPHVSGSQSEIGTSPHPELSRLERFWPDAGKPEFPESGDRRPVPTLPNPHLSGCQRTDLSQPEERNQDPQPLGTSPMPPLPPAKSKNSRRLPIGEEKEKPIFGVCSEIRHTPSQRFSHGGTIPLGESRPLPESERSHWWSTEPDVGRVAHGVASRVDRIQAIGNGQVPAVVALAWHLLA